MRKKTEYAIRTTVTVTHYVSRITFYILLPMRQSFFQKFRFQVILRVTGLILSIFLFMFVVQQTRLLATAFLLGIFLLYQTVSLIRYVEKTNQDLSRFFQAVKYADFSQSFSGAGLGSKFDDLKKSFAAVIEEFQKARAEKEAQHRFLQTVVRHVGIGLIAFREDGEVELSNGAAKRLLSVQQLKNIRSLSTLNPSPVDTLFNLQSGERALLKIQSRDEWLQLAVYATRFKLRGRPITLVSLQNIQSELEEKEMEAWQNLIRVLTHEIMNSVTPIASLAGTVNAMLEEKPPGSAAPALDLAGVQDIQEAVQTIRKRSEGLLRFVENYRKLTRLPAPNFQMFPAAEVFGRVQGLLGNQLQGSPVEVLTAVYPPDLMLAADPQLIEQALINLVTNALQALGERSGGRVELKAFLNRRGRAVIQVIDNGPGIDAETREKIFIPFFSTKQNGSGIGLSLCRQIMRLHGGSIGVRSLPGEMTIFTLRF